MKKLLLLVFCLQCWGAFAQTVHLLVPPRIQFLDNNGHPLKGGFLYAYTAGTTAPQNTYTDYTGSSPNTNPIVLDSGGFANVWLSDGLTYKFCLQNSLHVPQYCVDGVATPTGGGGGGGGGSFNPASPPPIGNTLPNSVDGTVVTAHNQFIGNLNGNVTGNVGGNLTGNVVGNVTGNVNGRIGVTTPSDATFTNVNVTGLLEGNLTGNVVGNVSGNLTGSVTGNVSGNATSATTATTANTANTAIALNGLVHFRTSATCNTPTAGGAQCNGTFSVPYSYAGPASWDVVCTGIGQTGSPFVMATNPGSGTTFTYVIGNASTTGVASGYSALACIAYGN